MESPLWRSGRTMPQYGPRCAIICVGRIKRGSVPHRWVAPEQGLKGFRHRLPQVNRSRMLTQESMDATFGCVAIRDRGADHAASQIGPNALPWAYEEIVAVD